VDTEGVVVYIFPLQAKGEKAGVRKEGVVLYYALKFLLRLLEL
jgi:hypothetical protein